jgi:hypothetical protein
LGREQSVRDGRRGVSAERGAQPAATIAALTYWSAKAITEQYLKAPGPLVRA